MLAGMIVLSAAGWRTAPDMIPMHWNLSGQIDGYLPKAEGLILWPALSLVLYLLLLFAPLLDPKGKNYRFFSGAYGVMRLAILGFITAFYGVAFMVMKGVKISMTTFLPLAVGLLFMVLGNYMGKIRPNWLVGIRTPWTLSDPTVWMKTHRVGGWLFVGIGFISVICAFIDSRAALISLTAGSIGGTLAVFIYSWAVWRGLRKGA